ncbi:MAG TPA: sigma 54-interacting transcriptional regulator, partial [Thermoanaerobaculia bacterium]|nr:sigma 54-interacting transcriptional regulator [Thermoanaerobaculia bacterium]
LSVDVRIIAATNRDLEAEIKKGDFREDLYYRLNVITVSLPPLRARSEDIPLLANHFLTRYSRENERDILRVTPEAMTYLMDYGWPGNVRELENVVERAVVLATGDELNVALLPSSVREREGLVPAVHPAPNGEISLKEAVTEYERQLIVRALREAGGVQKHAAEKLHVKPTTLHEMIKRLNISVEAFAS